MEELNLQRKFQTVSKCQVYTKIVKNRVEENKSQLPYFFTILLQQTNVLYYFIKAAT